mgnify:CR=1 FL=1
MSEKQEAIIRQQAILLLTRNQGKEYVKRRILERFIKCIRIGMLYN